VEQVLEYKHEALEQILSVELPMPKSTHLDTTAILVPSQVLHPILTGLSSYMKLQNCSELMTEQLEKAWSVYKSGESVLHDAVPCGSLQFKKPNLFGTSRKKDAVRGRSLTGEATVMVRVCSVCVLGVVGGGGDMYVFKVWVCIWWIKKRDSSIVSYISTSSHLHILPPPHHPSSSHPFTSASSLHFPHSPPTLSPLLPPSYHFSHPLNLLSPPTHPTLLPLHPPTPTLLPLHPLTPTLLPLHPPTPTYSGVH